MNNLNRITRRSYSHTGVEVQSPRYTVTHEPTDKTNDISQCNCISIAPSWFCAFNLLSLRMLVVESQQKRSGLETQILPKRGAYQTVKLDIQTIISHLWLVIASWFHIIGWAHQYNTFMGIMRAVSFWAVSNHPIFKDNQNGAKPW
ncbi:hypothetical protein [Fastidiosibacter lacustris]|uniref:hypothetical protein n=1 Tax=Fastidiosibacter lacustris TaxID=2056695 RepID=UPI000E35652B|nr:hypothetical protein [Fastidiosibacter lacustris]